MKQLLIFSIFSLILFQNSYGQNVQNMADYLKSIEYGMSLVKDKPQSSLSFINFADLPSTICSQSESWSTRILQSAALPLKANSYQTHCFIPTDKTENDLIEYKWEYLGKQLRMVESLNAIKLEFPINANGIQELGVIQSFVADTVKLKGTDEFYKTEYDINLQWPTSLENGVKFSSNPGISIIRIMHWHNRIDAMVQNDTLILIFYKKFPQLIGYKNGFSWISQHLTD